MIILKILIIILLVSHVSANDNLDLINKRLKPEKDSVEFGTVCWNSSLWTIDGLTISKSTFLKDRSQSCAGISDDETFKMVKSFTIENSGSPVINPLGFTDQRSVREYSFQYPENARQQIKMDIYENAMYPGRVSHWSMHSAVYFIPRLVIPYLEFKKDDNKLIVHLPTDEIIEFDASNREIIGGVLEETPVDGSENRHARKFPGLKYTGSGYMIRIDQRGELPEADLVWGIKKFATIYHNNKSCKVSASKLWDQEGGESSQHLFKFSTDEEFYKFIKSECNI